jgi:hypothetical protein
MKNSHLFTCLIALFCLSFQYSLAQDRPNPEHITNKGEASNLTKNFRTYYPVQQFGETGGTLSLATIQELYNQMVNTGSAEVVYKFGRTSGDANGKNVILFFNDVDVNRLNEIHSFKSVNICPMDCNPSIENYLK